MSFNVDNVQKQKRIVSKTLAASEANILLMQETKLDQIWQQELQKDFPGYKFALNAEDGYIEDFEDRIHKSNKPRQAGTGALVSEELMETVTFKFGHTHRFHEISMPGLLLLNVYLPSDGDGVIKQEEFRQCVSDLSEYIEDNKGTRHIVVCGDFNASKRQKKRSRWRAIEDMMARHTLEPSIPGFTTNYNPNNCETTIDFIMTSPE